MGSEATLPLHPVFPALVDPATLEASLFSGRRSLVDRLVDRFQAGTGSGSRHHTLLVGPWGAGKSHLVEVMCNRLEAGHQVARLAAPPLGVSSYLDLLLRLVRQIRPWEQLDPLLELEPDLARARLEEELARAGTPRPLVLVLEDLEAVFEGLDTAGQHAFRSFCQERTCCHLLATAREAFPAVKLRTSAFYGFFNLVFLNPLSLDEVATGVTRWATQAGHEPFRHFAETPAGQASLAAWHHLSGGVPRLLALFLSAADAPPRLLQLLEALFPWHRHILSTLSRQQQKIVEVLAWSRRALTVKETARLALASPQTISRQLLKMLNERVLQRTSVGRESYYELADPLLRLGVELTMGRDAAIADLGRFLYWYYRLQLESDEASDGVGLQVVEACLTGWPDGLRRMLDRAPPGVPRLVRARTVVEGVLHRCRTEEAVQSAVAALLDGWPPDQLAMLAPALLLRAPQVPELLPPPVAQSWYNSWEREGSPRHPLLARASAMAMAWAEHQADGDVRPLLALPAEERQLVQALG